jgi:hypothetical protein
MDFMAALGGRKNFGFLVSVTTLTIVSVFAPGSNFTELAAAIGGIFTVFVGGNVVNTLKAPPPTVTVNEVLPPAPSTDSTSVRNDIEFLAARMEQIQQVANEANSTANQAGEATLKLGEQVQGLKNAIAIALKK